MENSFHRGILPKKRKEIRKVLETNTAATAATASTTDPDIDGYDEDGNTVLVIACYQNSPEHDESLLDRGASVHVCRKVR